MESRGGWADTVTQSLRDSISERDSFYLGTASADGQPYIQHRGGPRGFLKVLDDKTLAFADYAGNAQYISIGNLRENRKAFIFLMDYSTQTRIKLWGAAEFIEDDPALLDRVVDPDYAARPQRVLVFHLMAWDVNCNQHIQRRFTEEELPGLADELHEKIAKLQAKNAELASELRALKIEQAV